jgi:hypothetical protein
VSNHFLMSYHFLFDVESSLFIARIGLEFIPVFGIGQGFAIFRPYTFFCSFDIYSASSEILYI